MLYIGRPSVETHKSLSLSSLASAVSSTLMVTALLVAARAAQIEEAVMWHGNPINMSCPTGGVLFREGDLCVNHLQPTMS